MWGIRCLHNFGKIGTSTEAADDAEKSSVFPGIRSKPKRVDEEDAMEGGLKGRISAGAEFYFSAKERSAGGKNRNLTYLHDMLKPSSFDGYPFYDTP